MFKIIVLMLLAAIAFGSEVKKIDDKKAPVKKYSLGLSYSLTTDFADDLDPRIYQHTYGVAGTLREVTPYKINFGASVGLYYKTLGSSIWADQSTGSNGMEFSALRLSASKNYKLRHFFTGINLGHSFLISDEDRYEGYRGITTLGINLGKSFFKKIYTISSSISGTYHFTEYSYSPSRNGAPNNRYSLTYTLNNRVMLGKYVSLSAGFSVKRTYKYDDFTNNSFMTFGAISGKYKSWVASIRFSNGDFLHRDNIRLWYVDEYRKVVSFRLGFSF